MGFLILCKKNKYTTNNKRKHSFHGVVLQVIQTTKTKDKRIFHQFVLQSVWDIEWLNLPDLCIHIRKYLAQASSRRQSSLYRSLVPILHQSLGVSLGGCHLHHYAALQWFLLSHLQNWKKEDFVSGTASVKGVGLLDMGMKPNMRPKFRLRLSDFKNSKFLLQLQLPDLAKASASWPHKSLRNLTNRKFYNSWEAPIGFSFMLWKIKSFCFSFVLSKSKSFGFGFVIWSELSFGFLTSSFVPMSGVYGNFLPGEGGRHAQK